MSDEKEKMIASTPEISAREHEKIMSKQKGNKNPSCLNNPPTEVGATRTSSYLNNLQLLNTPLVQYPPKHMVTEKLAHTNSTGVKQLLFKIDTVGSGELSVGIAQPFSSHRGHWNNLTIKPTIVHYNQAIVW